DLGNVAHLAGQVIRHGVDAVGEVLPGAGDAFHLRLTGELPFGADLARHTSDLGGEAVELVDHDVDRVLQLQDLAFGVRGDLFREAYTPHCRSDLGDVAHLARQVIRHQVHAVGEVLPGAGDPLHIRLTCQLALGAHLASDTSDFRSEPVELI